MKFYLFEGEMTLDVMHENKLDGTLFLFNTKGGDKLIKNIIKINELNNRPSSKNFNYMLALRPYTMSPQYMAMINLSFKSITGKNLKINLISGHIKEEEKDFGGILGSVNDSSSSADKSKYMVDFINLTKKMEDVIDFAPEIYVSVTNTFTYEAAKQNGYKVIAPYSKYSKGFFDDIDKSRLMVSLGPIIRDTEEEFGDLATIDKPNDSKCFTTEEFNIFLSDLEKQGIKEVMLYGWPDNEQKNVLNFVKKYKEKL